MNHNNNNNNPRIAVPGIVHRFDVTKPNVVYNPETCSIMGAGGRTTNNPARIYIEQHFNGPLSPIYMLLPHWLKSPLVGIITFYLNLHGFLYVTNMGDHWQEVDPVVLPEKTKRDLRDRKKVHRPIDPSIEEMRVNLERNLPADLYAAVRDFVRTRVPEPHLLHRLYLQPPAHQNVPNAGGPVAVDGLPVDLFQGHQMAQAHPMEHNLDAGLHPLDPGPLAHRNVPNAAGPVAMDGLPADPFQVLSMEHELDAGLHPLDPGPLVRPNVPSAGPVMVDGLPADPFQGFQMERDLDGTESMVSFLDGVFP